MLVYMKKKILLNILLLLIAAQIFLPLGSIVFAQEHLSISSIIKLPENENAILVEKKTQTLFLYTSRGSNLSVLFQAPCSTGATMGVKQEAGDKKTPEGVYFLNAEYEDKYLAPIYGEKAFSMDYPNLIDQRTGKNGSAIWIHGTNKKLEPLDSNGCIALENSSIINLSDHVHLNSTPVIVVEEIDKINRATLIKEKEDITLLLDQWIKAVEKGSYSNYSSFYSPEHLPDINWWEQWHGIRKLANNSDSKLRVERQRTGIYYHDSVFVVLFDYIMIFKNEKVLLGKRKLFLENQNSGYKIIGDNFQSIPEDLQTIKFPKVVAAKTLVESASIKESVLEMINLWLAAWSAKDMNKYESFYAQNFYSLGMNKQKWIQRKRMLAKKYDFINVFGKEFKVKQKKDTCEVTFFQEYESNMFANQGIKRLKLVNKGGLWKIYQESWREK